MRKTTKMSYMTYQTRKRQELLELVEASPPLSIYQLAKKAKRNYRRVHDFVHFLHKEGRVRLRPALHDGRRVMLIDSVYSQRLSRLDDLYGFHADVTSNGK